MSERQHRKQRSSDDPPDLHPKINQKINPPRAGTQTAIELLVFLFIFDSLHQHQLLFANGYWCKLSNCFITSPLFLIFCNKKMGNEGKLRKSSQLVNVIIPLSKLDLKT